MSYSELLQMVLFENFEIKLPALDEWDMQYLCFRDIGISNFRIIAWKISIFNTIFDNMGKQYEQYVSYNCGYSQSNFLSTLTLRSEIPQAC